MCRIGSIKSKVAFSPSKALYLMLPQQEGHDNSGFAMVMQDLYGIFTPYKDKPLLSLACTQRGAQMVEDFMDSHNFEQVAEWIPVPNNQPGLDIKAMPYYIFRNYDYPEYYRDKPMSEKEELLLNVRLKLREILEAAGEGYVYSFWPDVLTLKEIGDPRDIATYFRLWDDNGCLMAKSIVVQCRQNTNYDIVRYAAHPFFLQGYTLCANGENTFYTKNKEFQKSLHRGYVGFESDSQNFLYTLHYVLHELKWPIKYYKHVITPLPFAEIDQREDKDVLKAIRQSLANLEINGPNTIIANLPDGRMLTCCDSKKLRPVVVGQTDDTVAISSEVCGLNEIMPDRDMSKDIYPNEREVVVIDNDLEVQRWKQ
ncbi:glutamate synthase [Pectinatus cerevisiiphilus]|uniref:Glutamate synthase (NADPH) GltB1 subunit n=1 Tax=Pectinatus cerevisiiphilus TaxID=86956 RepID=A0A4R3KF67_9FIRM|nr:glutamate synthase [Pectinatus cerevisiiphilus]TCS82004.1 glutamate synthase (NADPH) GltB1 subunit [Pectinatus cerevisiiphilus]